MLLPLVVWSVMHASAPWLVNSSLRAGVLGAGITVGIAALGGCAKSDIGHRCGAFDVPATPGDSDNRTQTPEVVAQDPAFPCDDLICVATDGKGPYCSKKCRTDTACPDGFECRQVQPIGAFADDQFCVWKACNDRTDCGTPKDDFCCEAVPDTDPEAPLKRCAFSNKKGKCP